MTADETRDYMSTEYHVPPTNYESCTTQQKGTSEQLLKKVITQALDAESSGISHRDNSNFRSSLGLKSTAPTFSFLGNCVLDRQSTYNVFSVSVKNGEAGGKCAEGGEFKCQGGLFLKSEHWFVGRLDIRRQLFFDDTTFDDHKLLEGAHDVDSKPMAGLRQPVPVAKPKNL